MTEPTPGPWSSEDGSVYGAIANPTQGPHLHRSYTCERGHWATDPRSHVERGEDEEYANARLIAAAPEMYEALEYAEAIFSIVQPRSHMKEYVETLHQVRAALAKARGEAQEGAATEPEEG